MGVRNRTEYQPLQVSWAGRQGATRLQAQGRDAEAALRESEAKYKALVQQAKDGIYIVQDWVFKFVNAAMAEIHGFTVEEMLGMPFLETVLPEFRDSIARMHQLRMAGKEAPNFCQTRIRCKNGDPKEVEAFSVGVIDYDGGPAVMAIVRDVTERNRVARALRESERRYRLLAENVTDVIWVTDTDLSCTYVSPSIVRLRGYSAEETMAQKMDEVLTPNSLAVVEKALTRLRKDQNAPSTLWTVELEVKCRDGSTLWTEVKTSQLQDEDGQILGYLGVARDVNKRRQAENEVLRRSREIAALHRVLISTTQTLNLEEVLNEIVYQVGAVVRAEYTRVVLVDCDGVLRIGAEYPRDTARLGLNSQPHELTRRVAATGKPSFVDCVDAGGGVTLALSASAIKSYAGVPVKTKDTLIGVLSVHSMSRNAFASAVELLGAFANQASIAIENARLYEAVQIERSRVEQLLGRELRVQEDERRRLSLEIHDSVTQSAYGVSAHIGVALELLSRSDTAGTRIELAYAKKALEQTLMDLRRVSAGLHPPDLEKAGLAQALRRHVSGYARDNKSIICSFKATGEERRLPANVEIGAYRIVQEALNNVQKHAAADKVAVRLQFRTEGVSIEVSDNGKGFDFSAGVSGKALDGHFGLAGMMERAELIGGTLRVETRPAAGTIIELLIPA